MGLRTATLAAVALFIGASTQFIAGSAVAEPEVGYGPRRVPSEVIVYIHPEVTDRSFVDSLLCALERVLVAPVSTKDLPLLLGSDLKATRTQLDADKVADRFRQAVAADGDGLTFKHLIIAQDLTLRPYNYLFASTSGINGESSPLQVISTARLASQYSSPPAASEIALTTQRLYKVIIRSIVQNTGNMNLNGCVMAFPNSLAGHDRKSSEFCAADRARLVLQGVLRERDVTGCQAVAHRDHRRRVAVLRWDEMVTKPH